MLQMKLKSVTLICPFNCDYEAADDGAWISKSEPHIYNFYGSVTQLRMKLKLKAVDHIRPLNCDYEAADNVV